MAIINRLARLFKADFHAVLDHIEEPQQVLKQSLRDMAQELLNTETKIKTLGLKLENLSEQQLSAEKKIKQTNEEINVCLSNDHDDLARGLVKRKLQLTQQLDLISVRQTQAAKSLKNQKHKLQEQTSLHDSIQQKFELVCQSVDDSNQSHFSESKQNCFGINDSDIDIALLKEKHAFEKSSAHKQTATNPKEATQ